MLALISLDAVGRPLVDRMIAQGRLPNCAALMRRGRTYAMESTPIHASVYRSLYSGVSLSTHGVYYPLQWNASEQRVQPAEPLIPADSVFGRLDRAGRRTLVIDPPECGWFIPKSGIAISGWQFTTRFVIPEWYSSKRISRMLKGRFGPPQSCHEVFGPQSPRRLQTMREILESAPQRLADATTACLKEQEFDFLWVTFVAAHIAGHQLWRDSDALAAIYQRIDAAIGQMLSAFPPNTDVVLFSPNGMGPETSRADFVPAMLARVLNGRSTKRTSGAPISPLWRIRAVMPTSLRALVADAIPERLIPGISSYLENAGVDRKSAQAFALPSDGAGFVQLNLKGRERYGVVDPSEAKGLLDEIADGLATFVEPSGERMVATVLRSSDLDGPGPKSQSLPDLVVVWSKEPATELRTVTSARFGEVRRDGVGSGRSGNHTEGAWVCVAPGGSRRLISDLKEPVRAFDLASTACALMETPRDALPGRVLLS